MKVVPEGYSFTLFLSFDLDAESAEVWRRADPVAISRGRFGVKVGVWRVLEVLERYGLRVTFFVPGWVAENYPDVVKSIAEAGHEVAAHGYLHERLDELGERDAEENVFELAERFIGQCCGGPQGFRAPYWRWSENTLAILMDRGYLYDSSLMDSDEPYVIEEGGRRLVELPVDWRLDDWPYLEQHRCIEPRSLLSMWLEELRFYRDRGGYVAITMHPQCIGRGARIAVLRELVEEALAMGAWIPRGIDIARLVAGEGR